MGAKEHSPAKTGSENKSQKKPPAVEYDPREYETLLAAESVQRFKDGQQPPFTPGHLLALQRKVGNTAVGRLIDSPNLGQDRLAFQFGGSRRRQGSEAPSSTEIVPQIQRQAGGGGGGAGGAGGGTSSSDSSSGGPDSSQNPEGAGPVAPPAPGPPLKFGLAGTGVSFTLEKGEVAVGYEKSDDIINKTVGPIMFPLASGLGIVMSASLKGGLTGGGSVKGKVDEEAEPPGAAPGIMRETASFDASLEFKIGITGEVFFGLGAGIQAANIATGIAGSLEFAHKYKPRVSGYAIRYSYPEDGGQSAWDEWAGEITMEQDVRSEIVAQLKAVGRWHLFTESGDWFVVDIGNWPIYEIYSVGMTKYGMPDGDVSTSLDEGVKFLGVPMEVTDSGQGKPPWEFEGQEGAGPVGPGEGSGGASGEGRQGGSGGYGPAPVGEISEGEDIISRDAGSAGGAGGGSQEEGMLTGGAQGGAGGAGGGSQEEELQSSEGQGGAGGTGGMSA